MVCIPDCKRDEAQRKQAEEQIVSFGRVEIRPDLCPGLTHEPLSNGDIEAGHEGREEESQHQVRCGRLKVYAGNKNPANCKCEKRSGECAELDSALFADSRDDQLDSGDAVQSFDPG